MLTGYSVHALLSPDTFINWGLGLRIGLGIVTFSGLGKFLIYQLPSLKPVRVYCSGLFYFVRQSTAKYAHVNISGWWFGTVSHLRIVPHSEIGS